MLFGDERSVELLTDFLKSVLRIPAEEYDEVTIVDPHLLREYKGDKLGILDVKIKTKSKKVVNIEIQLKPTAEMKSRIVYSTSKTITEQMGSGDKYQEIKRVISIIIADYPLIPESPKYHHRFVLYDPDNGVEFTDIIEVNTLELKKLPEAEDGTELWNWLKFLSAERKEDLDMIAARSPQVKKAVVRLMELSNDERARMLYESRLKMEWDIQARERSAVKDNSIAIAKKLLEKQMSVNEVADATGLAHEEIEEISSFSRN
jgi:predicted transposase/invertase (TIGR01784 family)